MHRSGQGRPEGWRSIEGVEHGAEHSFFAYSPLRGPPKKGRKVDQILV